jgi:HPt (histidine-containing phosphotransfer) domain-containing protein
MSTVAAEATCSRRVVRGAGGGFAVPVLAAGRPVAWLEFKSLEMAVAAPTLLRLLALVGNELSAVAERGGSQTQPACCSMHSAANAEARLPSQAGVLDQNTLERLRQLDPNGVNRLLERVVKAFEASTIRLMPRLREGARTGDLDGVRQVAHSLRSASASIGAMKLSQLCADIETRARADERDDLAGRVKAMAGEVDVVLRALRSLPAGRP